MTSRAKRAAEGYDLSGAKAWISHGGEADFYTTFVRTGRGRRGISCFHLPAPAPGLSFGAPEHKMGLTALADHCALPRRGARGATTS